MKMAYNGSQGFVDVPALGGIVKRGEPVEIPSMTVAKALYRQGWSLVRENNDDNGKGDS
jgi:hypothetical protein